MGTSTCILGMQYILQMCCQGFDNNDGFTYKIAEALGNKSVVINFINFLPRSQLRKFSLMIVKTQVLVDIPIIYTTNLVRLNIAYIV